MTPLHEAAVSLALGRLLSDDVPEIAIRALEAGQDSPTLRRLAGLGALDTSDALRMLRVAMRESAIDEPSLIDAVMQRARVIASQILAGRMSGGPNSTLDKSASEIASQMRPVLLKQRITLNADGSASVVPSQGTYTARWTRTGDRVEVVAEFGRVMRVVIVLAVAAHELNLKSVEYTLEGKPPSAADRRLHEATQVKRWIRAEE